MVSVRQWRYRSAVVATLVVASGNISLFLGVALAQGNLKERADDECSIANIKQYVTQIEKNYSSELEAKFKKCSAVAVPWLIEQTKVNNADTQVTAISLLAMIGTPASSAAPRLIKLLQRSQNEDLRILVVGALPKVASSENLKSIIAVLGSTLKDKNQDVRFGSALSLVTLYKNRNKISFSDDNANTLRQLISKDVLHCLLISAFKYYDYNQEFRKGYDLGSAAIYALRTLRQIDEDIVPAWIESLQDKYEHIPSDVAKIFAYVLEKIDEDKEDFNIREDVNLISEFVRIFTNNENNIKTRYLAVEALRMLNSSESKLYLIKYSELIETIGWKHIESLPTGHTSTPEEIRIYSMRFNHGNNPKACENSLASLLIGWKCPRK